MSDELEGMRILVTSPSGTSPRLAASLGAMGAEVVELPMITFQPVSDQAPVARAIAGLHGYDIVVFTSATAVEALVMAATDAGAPLLQVAANGTGGPEVVAVGPATAEAARTRGFDCREVPKEFSGEGLAELLTSRDMRGQRILIPRAGAGGEELPAALRKAGAEVDVVALYRTLPDPNGQTELPGLLGSRLDMVTFTSGSAIDSFIIAAGPEFRRPQGMEIACIGPSTAKAARAARLEPDVVASEHTVAGLVAAIRQHAVASKSSRAG
ncbi:MAG TPA: uroporphyrinogen-III synthase [Candidatus Dormibacteraeota bacterium]|nr:uroporphyrinogen-III synthase [Candidatus Dormibacteraeota bacterium]